MPYADPDEEATSKYQGGTGRKKSKEMAEWYTCQIWSSTFALTLPWRKNNLGDSQYLLMDGLPKKECNKFVVPAPVKHNRNWRQRFVESRTLNWGRVRK